MTARSVYDALCDALSDAAATLGPPHAPGEHEHCETCATPWPCPHEQTRSELATALVLCRRLMATTRD